MFAHALSFLKEKEDYVPDIIVQLRPTYPFRDPADIDGDTGHGASHRITVGKTGVPEYACEAAVESLLLRVGEMELYDIDPLM